MSSQFDHNQYDLQSNDLLHQAFQTIYYIPVGMTSENETLTSQNINQAVDDENVKTYYDVGTKQIQSCSSSESLYSCPQTLETVTMSQTPETYNYPWIEQQPPPPPPPTVSSEFLAKDICFMSETGEIYQGPIYMKGDDGNYYEVVQPFVEPDSKLIPVSLSLSNDNSLELASNSNGSNSLENSPKPDPKPQTTSRKNASNRVQTKKMIHSKMKDEPLQTVENVPTDMSSSTCSIDGPILPELDEKTLEEIRKDVHPNKFPKKVWLLASDPRFTPIVWNSQGNGILINERLLKPRVLEKLFRSNKMASFLRQLHLYDFGKINRARSYSYIDENGEITRYQIDYISEYTRATDFLRSDISRVANIVREYRPAKKTVKRGFLFGDDDNDNSSDSFAASKRSCN